MNKKIILGIVLCAVCFSFCGCQLMTPVSEKDTEAIASYSAKMVAKYNKKQKDGVVYIDENDELRIAEEAAAKAKKANASQSANSSSTSSNSSSSKSNSTTNQTPPVPMATALGLSGVDIKYTGNEVKDNYTTSIYDMSPANGKKFLVMKFNITNTSGADQVVDILSKNPKFKATLNGAASSNNEVTLMPEDLSTFKGTLKPNESKELILLFQFKNEDLANIQSVALKCTANGGTNDITL